MSRISLQHIYLGLVLVRVCFAIFGTGFIHPDEYFQNGEVIAGSRLGVDAILTWEWNDVFPCRSIVPVWLTTGLSLSMLHILHKGPLLSPRLIFAAQRLPFLFASFILDYSVYHLVHDSARLQALSLLASSYVMHTYQVRPFSNSIEAALVALSLVLLRELLVGENQPEVSKRRLQHLALLASVLVCGLFTRITFAAFFLPIALEILRYCLRQTRFSLPALLRLLAVPLLVACITTLGFVYADSLYFHGFLRVSTVELTPLNFLRYNLLPSNLAEHGLHPRWLHLVVNLPLIATPGLLYYVLRAEFDLFVPRNAEKLKLGVIESMQRTMYWVRLSAISILSIQPHQEPRFLTPLLVPMIAMATNNVRILQWQRPFLVLWIVANLVLVVLFGILHQGGVVPSLFRVHDIVYADPPGLDTHDVRIIYWKTYMPPRHLLAIPQRDTLSKQVGVLDIAGASPFSALRTLVTLETTARPLSVILVAPFHAVRELDGFDQHQLAGPRRCVAERDRVFPHLDLDRLAESVQVGWRDGLSLGIFDVDVACLGSSTALPRAR
ncbi:Alg9-like mannosyltransferase family-domain-containing protein [Trametes gibbosa]|nr:Alg9-like mannosyltransferase family-domain-containing protein [Trametes gibbosa]